MASLAEVMAAAVTHHLAGNLQEAERHYRLILQADPHNPDVIQRLGVLAFQLGRLGQAVAYLEKALDLRPDIPHYHCNLAFVYLALGNLEGAIAENEAALRLDPHFATAHYNLGCVLRDQGKLDEALASYREAMRLKPTWPQLLKDYALVLMDMGLQDEALAALRRSLELQPDSASAHSTLCYALHFKFADDRAMLAREHQRWQERHAQPLEKLMRPHDNDPDPGRRLRVGYVSAHFYRHPVGRYLLPLLECHDHRQFEIFCYASVAAADDLSARLRVHADHWRDVAGLTDERLAELIREDGIDILVDLCAHMGHCRLLAFARKPAPVQVSYLGYNSTTGLRSMDYRISDPFMDPPGESAPYYSEETVWLPETYWCYRPDQELAPPGPLPALTAGHVMFGCLNSFWKVTPEVLSLWRELLVAVPGSRLLLHARPGSHRDRVRQFFAQAAVDPGRVEFVGHTPVAEYFPMFARLDIGLDPFPYTGGTTTCDALWMGVPVVSLAGKAPLSRAGLSILSNACLPDLVAWTPEEYVRLATALAGDLPRLAALRAGLRERVQQSPLGDAPRFARNVEAAFRSMWRRWCAARTGA